MINITRRDLPAMEVQLTAINDEPGVVLRRRGGQAYLALAVQVSEGKAHAIHVVRNPDKLAALDLDSAIL
jgi:hypothetical protein